MSPAPVCDLDQRLVFGPGMRLQRATEGVFVILAIITREPLFAVVSLISAALQALSPRLALVARLVALRSPAPEERKIGDLYFDLGASRGACTLAALGIASGLAVIHRGPELLGWLLLFPPAASLILSPTTGFCAGCFCWVQIRNGAARLGLRRAHIQGGRDVDIDADHAVLQ